MERPQQEEEPSRAKVIATLLFYMAAALVVTVNKWVLVKTTVPIFFIASQALIGTFLILLTKWTRMVKYETPLDVATAKKIIPVIAVNALSLIFGNLTLLYVDASFYQIARGLILPITVVMAYMLQANPPSKMALIGCGIVTLGFFVGAGGNAVVGKGMEEGVTVIGVIFGILGSVTTAYHAILIKRSLAVLNGSAMDLAYYSNFWAVIIMIPVGIATGELGEAAKMLRGETDFGRLIWGSLITGFFGFLIGIAGLLSVKVTSPVSHMTSSAARGVLQTIIGAWFFGDILTKSRICSVLIIILGSCQYIYVKHLEQEQRELAAKTAPYNKVEQFDLDEMDTLEGERGEHERKESV